MIHRAVISVIVVGILGAPHLRAQPQPAAPLTFEVASVKPNTSSDLRGMGLRSSPGGRFVATGVPLLILVATAYHLPFQSDRISGGPPWIRSERFDIEAKAPDGALPASDTSEVRDQKMRLMLQSLLADRFKLTIRRETKELPVYSLVVAKNGPKLKAAAIEEKDCPEGPVDNGVSCHSFFGGQGRGLHGKAVNMADLVLYVSNWTDRPTIDKTGLQGLYDIQTDGWSPMRPRPGPPGEGPEAVAMADPTTPTLFMVLDKLGLKLQPEKGPVEMFVIERVERPSEN
jgi:uncharacterized protein (TIGR03435 family)